jgi:hypothetical protein
MPNSIKFNNRTLLFPPQELMVFVTRLVATEYEGPQRRGFKRYPFIVPAAVMPIDHEYQPTEDAFVAVTRDLSSTGLSLFATRLTASTLLAVELLSPRLPNLQFVLQALRCKSTGRYYEIAGELVGKQEDEPTLFDYELA